MVLHKEVPKVHIFSTRAGDVIVRPDLNCYLLLSNLPTSPCAELWPLHPSLQNGEHYFSSRWHNSVYVIRDNKLLETQDLCTEPRGQARRLHPSCCTGQHYFIVAGGSFGIILSPGTVTAVRDLTTGEPDPDVDPGHHQWSNEKMGSQRSYLYWQLWDNFSGEFFSFHPSVLSFLPGGLGLAKGPAFGAWELLKTLHNYSNVPITKLQGVFRKVGCARDKLADVGCGWMVASLPDSPEVGSVAMALAKAQFALPSQYGGVGLNTEQEEWRDTCEKEETLQLTLQPEEVAYVWQYRLGLGKEAILFCREIAVTHSCDPPSEVPLPSSS
ncbi:uncharacterized protein LOC133367182 [Rhineura floridana]|uniref:uncharacterized protein LOC133367182 n=1 Tax=Rhineura floridana TaxID=261503 RepID=UPI002AC86B55|nr:uncharacterized protein LOC133367182 [Rhineura floridana]XP_061447075.1 uncharacterized protein LOC133367182 [Rhineura floridana]XP_061447076.1 uncharacterized protein LOC133367182 [Rhineura floridana]